MAKRPSPLMAIVSAFALLATPLAAAPAAAQRTEVGIAASVVGNVTLRPGGQGQERRVARKNRLAWGDLITTGRRSQLQILLLDRSSFGVGARTQLRIDRYVYDPGEGRSVVSTFIRGALRFLSGRDDDDNSAEVRTPAGRIGIRGTAVDMLVGRNAEKIAEAEDAVGNVDSERDEATLVVLRGPGPESSGGLRPGLVDVEGAGQTVTLDAPGLAAYIPRAGAAPIGPFRLSDGGLADLHDEIAPEVARASKGGGLLETLIPIVVGAITVGLLLTSGDDDPERPVEPPPPPPSPQGPG